MSTATIGSIYEGFLSPPPGYGEVPFYWWVGEPLTKERLEWQLEQLKDSHISGLQINYAHDDHGGNSYGLTFPSDPPLFSEEWWELFVWFAQKAAAYGMSVSLSDYTLCTPGQGGYTDEIIKHHPDIAGSVLSYREWEYDGDREYKLPDNTISVTAYRLGIDNESGSEVEVLQGLPFNRDEGTLIWQKPEGEWKLVAVFAEKNPCSIDVMHPQSGAKVVEYFFQRFEDRLAGIPGVRLGFFFSDELDFGIRGQLWNDRFQEEFIRSKGYDIVPEAAALFVDIGQRTSKIRMDYGDVMVALSEKNYFQPVYEWHQARGIIFGCDHGGRGKEVAEFGDYFRTQRWNQGPGCDQPALSCDLVKNKVASSIAHLNERPRTWLEGYHSSGWGTTTAELADATFKNFLSGHNLLSLHGLYYTTYGGWWEWAPPCNHFRMPYWQHMKSWLACTERLSYLLSQGVHACDVAVMYPVAAMEAGISGEASVETAFGVGEYLYRRGIDFDFIDFESLDKADLTGREIRVSGEAYRVLILPAMRALRYSTLIKALAFYEAGGIVIAVGPLPEASDRMGAADAEVDAKVQALFGLSGAHAAKLEGVHINRNAAGGASAVVRSYEETAAFIQGAFPRDFVCMREPEGDEFPYVMHRKMGDLELYAVYGAELHSECFFRCHGSIELWNPWDGTSERIVAHKITPEGTFVQLPLGRDEIQLIVFHRDQETNPSLDDDPGVKSVRSSESGRQVADITLDGKWTFELLPTMNNRFGDFRLPPTEGCIGAEARRFQFAWEQDGGDVAIPWSRPECDDSDWPLVTYGYGPFFWKLGPLPDRIDTDVLEANLSGLQSIAEGDAVRIGNDENVWETYEFSMRFGIEEDPGHQGFHGLKGEITDDFIALGRKRFTWTGTEYEAEETGRLTYLWSSFHCDRDMKITLLLGGMVPSRIWLNGRLIEPEAGQWPAVAGVNRLLLRYDAVGRGHVIVALPEALSESCEPLPLAMSWYNKPGLLPYDIFPEREDPAGWYRFTAPPALEAMEVTAHGEIKAWVDGNEWPILSATIREDGATVYRLASDSSCLESSAVAIRVVYDKSAYAGAALPEPIRLDCGRGLLALGDWSDIDGLMCYSGGGIYRKGVNWSLPENPVDCRVLLDLGDVASSAEIRVNGGIAGTLTAPPWRKDISRWLRRGDNEIEIRVYNTLANHYVTIPTRYRGDLTSGLLGPVRLDIWAAETT
ncbi:glycosyl hydrolase [Paenibacillus sp. PAMC21692]|uniref:glycosyl hydrolase n=1 Tax=Paenibacillus sp. PAMC21692 TaxID=2762320 RepID=UPI00164DDDF7|nr:glycosyl hydrolase [Paenibacillus sp. PAMC21692]QNK57941.1 hypothetical protein H7F31_02945 [Paenibacillus sp. PAMC21692]